MSVREIAQWLANIDSNGCSDEEFAETFVLMFKIWKTQNNDYELDKKDMKEFDIDKFLEWLRICLGEIIQSEEIDVSAWWKQEDIT